MENQQERAIERLIIFIKRKNISKAAFERKCNISNGYISNQLKHNGTVGSKILLNIKNIFDDIDLDWIITGVRKSR